MSMALRKPPQNRPFGPARTASNTKVGNVRRGQAVTTYGVGAMIAVDDQSFVVCGLDDWKIGDGAELREPRLERRLGVQRFHMPPADETRYNQGVGVRRFPTMYSCPSPTCRKLQEYRKFGATPTKNKCICDRTLVPSRFVVACENGHLDDFPYWEWVHHQNESRSGPHDLLLYSDGRSASLRSVIVECSCGHKRSLEGAFGKKALDGLGIRCTGRRPWLGKGTDQPGCIAAPRALQRGASASWFAVVRSSLSIPPWSNTLDKHVAKHFQYLVGYLELDLATAVKLIKSTPVGMNNKFDPVEMLKATRQRKQYEEDGSPDAESTAVIEAFSQFRMEEYPHLHFGTDEAHEGDDFECTRPGDFGTVAPPTGIERSMLVKRLREVRALHTFTRVAPPGPVPDRSRYAALSKEPKDWLPAIEVSGEGVFLAMDSERLREWEAKLAVRDRAGIMQEHHNRVLRNSARSLGDDRSPEILDSPISARYVLLHTLAHALINEWSLDAGYPAASLRERIYVADQHAGLLIYTATSDSAGSLGGVVAQGEHSRLAASLASAMDRLAWCSQDPPCAEAEAAGTDSLNLAACYACVMVPESSCETNNSFLDRGLLIGTAGQPEVGFFSRT
ncbi:DUF1998 domain-containing protein [Crossiella cryophila]|uniref:MrfA-like Zn-binding domain-containing protein n=1 Tax=Crossiella cryophila TaxID=43355 RepID=A0A7W7FTI5_9PSEU|nr:DUF1998 domain-containing protein [Crossiella cryophila]MBB4676463.1 hypothetical protein [Crossiella cryophila]